MEIADITIIGAGIVGLAIAASLKASGRNVFLIERHESFGNDSSSRSSEVIHAGIYYQKGSLKGLLCLEGNEMIYDICKRNNIPHANTGKLIIATDESENEMVPVVYNLASANGAKGVRVVGKDEIARIEPKVKADYALWCPTSGIVDSHLLMKHFESVALTNGVSIAYSQELVSIDYTHGLFELGIRPKGGEVYKFSTRILVNSAGLASGNVAGMLGIDQDRFGYRINYDKGIYFRVTKKLELYPKVLVYPVPTPVRSIDIHTTPDMYGGMRLGPHFEWTDVIDYSVDDSWQEYFYQNARKFLPFIDYEDIQPDMAGIMASVRKPGEGIKDFIIRHEEDKGFPGLINLIGIDSPGLTASPAIGKYVNLILENL